MLKLTVVLVMTIIVLACAGCLQAVRKEIPIEIPIVMPIEMPKEPPKEIPGAKRRRVEIWPVEFRVSNERHSKDPTSVFCYLTLQIINYGKLPITEVTLVDLKLGSKSRGYFSQKDYTKRPSDATLLPGAAFDLEFHFVMNPDWHIPKYNAGSEDFKINPEITYRVKKSSRDRGLYRYTCNWKYSKKSFYFLDNNTQLVKKTLGD